MAYGSTISFGPWQYLFKKSEGNSVGRIVNEANMDRCQVCRERSHDDVRILPCGHNVLQGHRDHELRQRVDRLRDLDEVDQKTEALKKVLAEMERKQEKLSTDPKWKKEPKSMCVPSSAPSPSFHDNLKTCRHLLKNIQNRKLALGRRWDETSRDMAEMFDRTVQESLSQFQYLERLRNNEISVSLCSSISDDEDEDDRSMLVESPPTASSSTA